MIISSHQNFESRKCFPCSYFDVSKTTAFQNVHIQLNNTINTQQTKKSFYMLSTKTKTTIEIEQCPHGWPQTCECAKIYDEFSTPIVYLRLPLADVKLIVSTAENKNSWKLINLNVLHL